MSLKLFIALRCLKAKRKGLFAVVTTSIGVAGVTVGVAALITTLSVMNGFQVDIQRKIIGAQAHVLKGLDPAREFAVNDLAKKLVQGVELADRMGAKVGGEVVLVSPKSIPLRPSVSRMWENYKYGLKGRSENRILA